MVGDDDQGIYRFRGASVGNLLEFPGHFPDCRTLELITNYRSHSGIVATANAFMSAGDWTNPDGGPPFRYPKTIRAHAPDAHADYPAVIAVAGRDPADECRQLVELVRFLKRRGVITDYSQVALLLHSVGRVGQQTVSGRLHWRRHSGPLRAGRFEPGHIGAALPGRAGGGDDDPPGQGAGVAGGHCGIGRF